MYSTFDRLREKEVEQEDEVKILTVDRAGTMAVILGIEDDAVDVTFSNTHESLMLNISHIRKYVGISDKVKVTAEPHARFMGWALAIANNELQVFNQNISSQ